MPPRTGCLGSGHLLVQLPAGLSTSPMPLSRLVSTKSGEGSIGTPTPHSRSVPRPATVRLPADLGVAAAPRLARESEVSTTTVSAGGFAIAHARTTAETYRTSPKAVSGTGGAEGTLEHGFCP